jgi:hypothetical protein
VPKASGKSFVRDSTSRDNFVANNRIAFATVVSILVNFAFAIRTKPRPYFSIFQSLALSLE